MEPRYGVFDLESYIGNRMLGVNSRLTRSLVNTGGEDKNYQSFDKQGTQSELWNPGLVESGLSNTLEENHNGGNFTAGVSSNNIPGEVQVKKRVEIVIPGKSSSVHNKRDHSANAPNTVKSETRQKSSNAKFFTPKNAPLPIRNKTSSLVYSPKDKSPIISKYIANKSEIYKQSLPKQQERDVSSDLSHNASGRGTKESISNAKITPKSLQLPSTENGPKSKSKTPTANQSQGRHAPSKLTQSTVGKPQNSFKKQTRSSNTIDSSRFSGSSKSHQDSPNQNMEPLLSQSTLKLLLGKPNPTELVINALASVVCLFEAVQNHGKVDFSKGKLWASVKKVAEKPPGSTDSFFQAIDSVFHLIEEGQITFENIKNSLVTLARYYQEMKKTGAKESFYLKYTKEVASYSEWVIQCFKNYHQIDKERVSFINEAQKVIQSNPEKLTSLEKLQQVLNESQAKEANPISNENEKKLKKATDTFGREERTDSSFRNTNGASNGIGHINNILAENTFKMTFSPEYEPKYNEHQAIKLNPMVSDFRKKASDAYVDAKAESRDEKTEETGNFQRDIDFNLPEQGTSLGDSEEEEFLPNFQKKDTVDFDKNTPLRAQKLDFRSVEQKKESSEVSTTSIKNSKSSIRSPDNNNKEPLSPIQRAYSYIRASVIMRGMSRSGTTEEILDQEEKRFWDRNERQLEQMERLDILRQEINENVFTYSNFSDLKGELVSGSSPEAVTLVWGLMNLFAGAEKFLTKQVFSMEKMDRVTLESVCCRPEFYEMIGHLEENIRMGDVNDENAVQASRKLNEYKKIEKKSKSPHILRLAKYLEAAVELYKLIVDMS